MKNYRNEEFVKLTLEKPSITREYYVSNYGRVKSVHKETGHAREVKGTKGKGKLLTFTVKHKDKTYTTVYVHQAIARNFLEAEPDKKFIIHLDGDRMNNNVKNLKWVTLSEQAQWYNKIGIYNVKDPSKKHSKINSSQVRLIREYAQAGKTRKRIIAKRFGITTTQVNRILSGENWAWVE